MSYDVGAFVFLSLAALGAAWVVSRQPSRWVTPGLLAGAVAMRVVGAFVRHEVLFRYYRGVGDARGYYGAGLEYARKVWSGEPIFLYPSFWFGDETTWWGTSFVSKLSGAVLTVIGPSLRAEFLAFSLIALVGLYAVCESQRRLAGPAAARALAVWVWFWPSLWFWPSSVGKEAVTLLAIGLVALGYVGRSGRIGWLSFVSGLALAFFIRPHVAALLVFAATAAHWLGSWRAWGWRRAAEGVVLVGLGIGALLAMTRAFGLSAPDLEGVQEMVEFRSSQTLRGGSSIGAVPMSAGGLPLALVNFAMRPFPWEAHNLGALFAAVEVAFFLVLAIYYRRSLLFTLRNFRRHRLTRFAVPFVLAYATLIGMTFGNLGLLARQRSIAFPFALLIVVAAAAGRWSPVRAAAAPAAVGSSRHGQLA